MKRHATEGPARRRALVASGLVAVLLLGACKSPIGRRDGGDAVGQGGPPPELGLPASPLPVDGSGGTTTSSAPGGQGTETATTAPGAPWATTTTALGQGPTATTIPDTYRTVATTDDRRGDHGEGPGYADLVTLTVERGTRTMRFVLDMGAALPATLAGGEVEGVGVDLYRGLGLDESAYQVFVDGGSDGWRAYFQRGTAFVQYPGTFRLGGGRLELVVPLSAFAEGEPDRAAAFADWSHRTDGGNRNSEDVAPELGSGALAR